MYRLIKRLTLVCIASSALVPFLSYASHPVTVDDILRMGDVGRVLILQDSRSLVYEKIARYEDSPNLGTLFLSSGDRSALSKLYRIDLVDGSKPSPLFEQNPQGGYWIGAASPDRRRVAVYSMVGRKVRAGVFDVQNRNIIWFNFTPNYSRLVQRPVWISADELVYAAMPDGQQPAALGRLGAMSHLLHLWDKAIKGVEPSATVIRSARSGVSEASNFRAGSLVRVNARTGSVVTIADGYFYNLRLSPNARYLAGLKEAGRIQQNPDQAAHGGVNFARKQLVIIKMQGNVELEPPCRKCDVSLGTISWSPVGDSLAFSARSADQIDDLPSTYQYEVSSETLVDISDEAPKIDCVRKNGVVSTAQGVMVFGVPADATYMDCDGGLRADWFYVRADSAPVNLTSDFSSVSAVSVGVGGEALYVLADGDVWRLQVDGDPRNVTNHMLPGVGHWGVRLNAGAVSDEVTNTGREAPRDYGVLQTKDKVVVIDFKSGGYETFAKPNTNAKLLAIAAESGVSIHRVDTSVGSFLFSSQSHHRAQKLVSFNTHLRAVKIGERVRIKYKIAGGASLSSCMILPPSWSPGRRYPLIAHVYPNTDGDCWDRYSELLDFNPNNYQLLASQGYIVLFVSTPRNVINTEDGPTQGLTKATLAAVNEAVRSGYADPSRIGVLGFSQGHHSALQVVAQTQCFRAAVAMYGISNFSSEYGTTSLRNRLAIDDAGDSGIGDFARFEGWMGAKPWEAPAHYVRNSPVFQVADISTPVLIIHSDLDLFPLGQSEEIFSALYRLRKPAAYVTYWGEGHGNLSPANIRDVWQRIFRWYDAHLDITRDERRDLIFDGPFVKAREPFEKSPRSENGKIDQPYGCGV